MVNTTYDLMYEDKLMASEVPEKVLGSVIRALISSGFEPLSVSEHVYKD